MVVTWKDFNSNNVKTWLSPVPFIKQISTSSPVYENVASGLRGNLYTYDNKLTLDGAIIVGHGISGIPYTSNYADSKFFASQQKELRKIFLAANKLEVVSGSTLNFYQPPPTLTGFQTYHDLKLLSLNFSDDNLMSYCRYTAEFSFGDYYNNSISNYTSTHQLSEYVGFRPFTSNHRLAQTFSYYNDRKAHKFNNLNYPERKVYQFSFSETATSPDSAYAARRFIEQQNEFFLFNPSPESGDTDLSRWRYYIPTGTTLINRDFSYSVDYDAGTYTRNLTAECVPIGTVFTANTNYTIDYNEGSVDPIVKITAETHGPENRAAYNRYEYFERIASGVFKDLLTTGNTKRRDIALISDSRSKLSKTDYYIENYSLEYKRQQHRPAGLSGGVLDFDINISYTHPGDIFSIIPIIGRPSSLLQVGSGKTSRKTNVDISLYLLSGIKSYKQSDINLILSDWGVFAPSGVKESAPTTSFDETNGILKYSIQYVHT